MPDRGDALALYQAFGVGRGTYETFSVAAPGAGVQFSRTTATGYYERFVSLFFLFTTSAAVANRQVAVEVQDGDGNVIGGSAVSQVQAASLAGRYYGLWAGGSPNAAAVIRQPFPLPQMYLQPSWKLVSNVALIDVADAFTLIRGVVERFGIGPDGTPVGETTVPYTERGRGYVRTLESE